ncbi:MAG: hypothetical protein QOI74_2611, partial [Micromonosporaceae bacterium]|nr:hypothetical protein [Micromonosporaceae bacterium]
MTTTESRHGAGAADNGRATGQSGVSE